ncbi:hypothetical protein [Pseudonocardia humida]|uniref:Uncharacterized protein n=1 Tax=Pseudonocardia humida TaxID=2800819 RepID=A0ABT1A6R4_9PSEU|nr:hypothetical protein [Pseudonocardia humida]MCO1658705.1 hypothetical protein [Pseudonocardia humida]
MTLLAVGVLGGALFVANTVGSQESPAAENTTAAANTAATAPPAAPPPAAAEGEAPAAPEATGREVDLSGVEVAGAGEGGAEDAADGEDAAPAEEEAPPAEEDARPPESTFAGESNDGALTVAIAVNGNDAAAVVADGETEFVLDGSATANGLALKDRTGKVKLDGDNPGDGFTGSVTLDGERVRYTADPRSVAQARADGRADVGDAADRVGL